MKTTLFLATLLLANSCLASAPEEQNFHNSSFTTTAMDVEETGRLVVRKRKLPSQDVFLENSSDQDLNEEESGRGKKRKKTLANVNEAHNCNDVLLFTLPTELLYEVLKHLSLKDYSTTSRVCKTLYNVAETPFFLKELFLRNMPRLSWLNIGAVFQQREDDLTPLSLVHGLGKLEEEGRNVYIDSDFFQHVEGSYVEDSYVEDPYKIVLVAQHAHHYFADTMNEDNRTEVTEALHGLTKGELVTRWTFIYDNSGIYFPHKGERFRGPLSGSKDSAMMSKVIKFTKEQHEAIASNLGLLSGDNWEWDEEGDLYYSIEALINCSPEKIEAIAQYATYQFDEEMGIDARQWEINRLADMSIEEIRAELFKE